jgi:hypothetical protein
MSDDVSTDTCPMCIDGWSPYRSVLIGPCFQKCRACQPVCAACHGLADFPAQGSREAFVVACNLVGVMPMLCQGCLGVLQLLPHPKEPTP